MATKIQMSLYDNQFSKTKKDMRSNNYSLYL